LRLSDHSDSIADGKAAGVTGGNKDHGETTSQK
jgi:hypothetical protein